MSQKAKISETIAIFEKLASASVQPERPASKNPSTRGYKKSDSNEPGLQRVPSAGNLTSHSMINRNNVKTSESSPSSVTSSPQTTIKVVDTSNTETQHNAPTRTNSNPPYSQLLPQVFNDHNATAKPLPKVPPPLPKTPSPKPQSTVVTTPSSVSFVDPNENNNIKIERMDSNGSNPGTPALERKPTPPPRQRRKSVGAEFSNSSSIVSHSTPNTSSVIVSHSPTGASSTTEVYNSERLSSSTPAVDPIGLTDFLKKDLKTSLSSSNPVINSSTSSSSNNNKVDLTASNGEDSPSSDHKKPKAISALQKAKRKIRSKSVALEDFGKKIIHTTITNTEAILKGSSDSEGSSTHRSLNITQPERTSIKRILPSPTNQSKQAVIRLSAQSKPGSIPYPVITDPQKIFSIEPTCNEPSPATINFAEEHYSQLFYPYVHSNFIGTHNSKKEDVIIISVRRFPKCDDGSYLALKTTKKGSELFNIPVSLFSGADNDKINGLTSSPAASTTPIQSSSTSMSSSTPQSPLGTGGSDSRNYFAEFVVKYLDEKNKSYTFHHVHDQQIANDILKMERKHPQKQKAFKVGLLYSKGGEQTLKDIFNSGEPSDHYNKFLDLIGRRISLKNWKRYRGDLGTGADSEEDSYYTDWRGIEVMYHICLWMNAEQHRRLIGNDIVFIIFHEEGTPFDPTPIDAIGTVPQVFCVVQPHNDASYRLALFTRPNIKAYEPLIPQNYLISKSDVKDFLLTKLYNGYCQAVACPPMNRLFEVPRVSTMLDVTNKYPPMTSKEIKEKMKESRDVSEESSGTTMFFEVLCARNLPYSCSSPTMNTTTQTEINIDPYCIVNLVHQRQKTKPTKRTCDPDWDERFTVDISTVDPFADVVEIYVKDYNNKNVSLGHIFLKFSEVYQNMNKEVWFPLYNDLEEETEATICLYMEITGAGQESCNHCSFYLGNEDFAVYKGNKYHTRCLVCNECYKNVSENFVCVNNQIFCPVCSERYFENNASLISKDTTSDSTNEEPPKLYKNCWGCVNSGSTHDWIKQNFKSSLQGCGFCMLLMTTTMDCLILCLNT
eukprot:TRINITY_DN4696_c0_g1_i3.p1 TRINITY_DN4696_c0_g1~~TRINITY_DN4696_c0_g1_i3.p1  ORF type:complete len:1061 (+),score=242.47 TRINITY_DN4696_c0_g1_i3:66-3248(+)